MRKIVVILFVILMYSIPSRAGDDLLKSGGLTQVNGVQDISGPVNIDGSLDSDNISLGGVPLSRLASEYPTRGDLVNVAPIPVFRADGAGISLFDVADDGGGDGVTTVYFALATETVIRQDGSAEKVCIWIKDRNAVADNRPSGSELNYLEALKIGFWRRDFTFGATGIWADSWDLIGLTEDLDDSLYDVLTGDNELGCVTLDNPVPDLRMGDYVAIHVTDGSADPASATTFLTEYASTNNAIGDLSFEATFIEASQQNFDWNSGGDADSVLAEKSTQVEVYMKAPQVIFHGPSYFTGTNSNDSANHEGYAIDYDIDDLHPKIAPEFMFKNMTGMTVQSMGQAGQSAAQLLSEFPTFIADLKPRIYVTPYVGNDTPTGAINTTFLSRIELARSVNMVVVITGVMPNIVAGFDDIETATVHAEWELLKTYAKNNWTNVFLSDLEPHLGEVRTLSATGRTSATSSWDASTVYEQYEPVTPDSEECSGDPYFQVFSCVGDCESEAAEPAWNCGKGAMTTEGSSTNGITWEHKGDISELLWDVKTDATGYALFLSDAGGHFTPLGNSVFANTIVNAVVQTLNKDTENKQQFDQTNFFSLVKTTDTSNVDNGAVFRLVAWDTQHYGATGWFDSSVSGHPFRPKKAGVWMVNIGVSLTGRAADDETWFFITKGGDSDEAPDCTNGTEDYFPYNLANKDIAITNSAFLSFSGIIYLDGADDWLIVCAFGGAGDTTDIVDGYWNMYYLGGI